MKYLGWILCLVFIGILVLFYNFKYLPTETDLIRQTDENMMWQNQIQELKKANETPVYQKTLNFDDLFSSQTSFNLTKKGETILKTVFPELQKQSGEIMVCGHTDNTTVSSSLRRKYPSNWEFSTAKAIVVLKYLIELGVKPERLTLVGYADTRPIEDNTTKEGRQKNRRIEIIVRNQ